MSSTLTAKPVNPKESLDLSDELKFALRKRYDSHCVDDIFDMSDIPYLEGVRDAGCEDAGRLIEYIEKYERVRVVEEY